jgi:hypothetical protein
MRQIHRSEITSDRWINTSFARNDGREEFREKPEYGNLHVIFNVGSDWGEVHVDEHNPIDFPVGTVNHLAKYTEEKTSIPKEIATAGLVVVGLFVGYKLLKFLGEEIG